MATPGSKQQGKELHQLKLTLTKYPRTTSVKVPTPTKQHPTKVGTVVSPTYQNPPPPKVLKLSDVLSLPVSDQVTSPTRTKTISTGISHQTSVVHPPTSKSPKQQHVLTMTSEPVTVKSPTRKRPIVVGSPTQMKQMRQQQQQLLSANPVVAKSPKAKTMDGRKGELPSIKPKPPPLKLIVVEEETKKVQKHSKKSQSILPTSRVRTIMKTNIKSSTSDGPLNIGQDSVAVISKATEMFIAQLMKESHKTALECCHKEITYGHLAKTVRKDPEQNKFLYDILPEKVLVRDYLSSLNTQDHAGAH